MNTTVIESLDHEGRGVAHVNGKTIFIEGALPGETVTYVPFKKKPAYEFATTKEIVSPSFMRVTPKCAVFGTCGGCSMQHLEAGAQVAMKQRVLEDNLWHIGKVRAEAILPPIYGPTWGYRHRARLSVRYVEKKGGVLIGFHEKRSSFVVDMAHCEVLPERISNLIVPLRQLVEKVSIREHIPQIEVAVGAETDVLVLRILEPFSAQDEGLLRAFADQHNVQFYLQTKGPDTVHPFYPPERPLNYTLPEYNINMPYKPTEFTQVNPHINQVLVRRAMTLLEPQPGERILDLFCGLGNFTLPIARCGATVIGIEGDQALTRRARENAELNGLGALTEFQQANLFEMTPEKMQALGHFDRMLIDPPRDGAMEVVKSLGSDAPRRIVYVSCNPATLARDAAVLVHAQGYAFKKAGVVNMFPHTGHVESIAVFEK